MSREEGALDVLPHRYPFLFVDRVLLVEPGRRAIGLKNVSIGEQLFLGHFRNQPIFPGALITECLAQLSGIVLKDVRETGRNDPGSVPAPDTLSFLAQVKEMRFRRPVIPGDLLILTSELDGKFARLYRFDVRADVDGEIAAEGKLMIAVDVPKA